MLKPFASRTQLDMKDVLLNPAESVPDIHYYMIRGGVDKKNITVWEVGTVGEEYIKTYGHYHVGQISETYSVISGQGIALLQIRKNDSQGSPIDDEIENFFCINVKAGDNIFIPSGVGFF